ncbi:MAG: hypothetical protein K2M67_02290 [Muribaculaceae bacterium]|nr:hypothetical protein [Muribaculaceae bacterium]
MKKFLYCLMSAAIMAGSASLSAKDLNQFIINGQSLSTGHQSWPVVSTENIPGNYMMGSEIWINAGTGYDHSGDWHINPLIGTMSRAFKEFDNNHRNGGAIAECPLLGAVNHMQLTFLKDKNQDILATSVGVSGAAIEELSKECTQRKNYGHFLESLRHAKEESILSGYDAISCPAIFWMQGEFNYSVKDNHCGLNAGEDNCTDRKTYKSLLLRLKENMQNDIMTEYGQKEAPVWITYQTGGQYVRDRLSIAMAQLEAANENADIIMAGSPYPCTDRGGHLDANGYRWFGEMLAKAYYKSQVLGEKVVAMQPRRITREDGGRTIRVSYHVPVGKMVFDTDLLPKIQNYGFNVYHNGYGSGARQKMTSIEIEGDDVVMRFDTPLIGKVIVTYGDPLAMIENQPSGLNHLMGHGNLRDSDPYQSALTYIDLDAKDENGEYVYSRNAEETRLRPDYEPKDADGNVIYGRPYPLYNFGVAFYYTLDKKSDSLEILDDDLNPLPVAEREPGILDVAYVEADGDDTKADGSESAPFASLNKAVEAVKWDGGKVVVKGKVDVKDELDLEDYVSLTITGEGPDACLDGGGATRLAETEKTNITLSGLTLSNFVSGGAGAVISMTGGDFIATDVTFSGNATSGMSGDNGGALSFRNCGDISLSRCTFSDNSAFLGGAVYVTGSHSLYVSDSLFEANKAAKNSAETNNNSRGGAISITNTDFDADNCVFVRNESTNNQSGVFQIAPGSIEGQHFTLRNCDILDNKAPKDHGGVFVAENSMQKNFEYNLINCTIAGNSASGCGSVAWILNGASTSPTQTLNIYNCTITGNHGTGNTYHNTVFLWGSDIHTNIVNTIFEGNTVGSNNEYADLHAGEFTEAKSGNIRLSHSVLGRFHTLRQDETPGEKRGVPQYDESSRFDISPAKASDGEANYAGILPRNEENAYIFNGLTANGVGMGDDSLLADRFGITTDRFGSPRRRNCIGSVDIIDGVTGVSPITAPVDGIAFATAGDMLEVAVAESVEATVEVYSIEGLLLSSAPVNSGSALLPLSRLGRGIRIIRVVTADDATTSVVRL